MEPTTHMLMLTSMHAKLASMQFPLLVLGARVEGGEPGSLLRSRLDRAVVMARLLPEEPIIVSGYGEAEPMATSSNAVFSRSGSSVNRSLPAPTRILSAPMRCARTIAIFAL